jgi:xylulokinase
MKELIAALDLGSSSVKASIFTRTGTRLSYVRESVPPVDPELGTFDAKAYARSAMLALKTAVACCRDARAVQGIALASQRATVLAVDSHGEPVTSAFSWQFPADGAGVARVRERLGDDGFQSITGMPPLPFVPLFRLSSPGSPLSDAARAGFRLGSLPDFLLCHLGARKLRTDPSLASATGMFDVREGVWHEGLLQMAGLTPEQLPELVAAGAVAGRLCATSASWLGLASDTPLFVGGGDQQCAVLGAGLGPGDTLASLGTSAAILRPIDHFEPAGPALIVSAHVLSKQWVVERFLGSFGSTLERAARFLRFESVAALEQAAAHAELDPQAPLFVPSMGEAPSDFHQAWQGVRAAEAWNTCRDVLAAAVLEGLARELAKAIAAVGADAPARALRVAGGGARGARLMREVASALQRPILRCDPIEAALFGAACLAFSTTEGASELATTHAKDTFLPEGDEACRKQRARRFSALDPLHP